MCRNIRNLHNFDPPTTDDEVRDAALQFVRKISGSTKPSKANEEAFERAVEHGRRGLARAARLARDDRAAEGPRGRGRQGARPRAGALRRVTAERVPSPSPYAPVIGFSAAVRAGDLVFVAGMTAVRADGAIVGEDAYAQAREALRKVARRSRPPGARLDQVVQTRMYLADAADWEAVGRAHGEVFGDVRPAAAMLVTGLLDPRMRVEIEAVAHVGDR